VSGKDV
jgi:hypothetical protein